MQVSEISIVSQLEKYFSRRHVSIKLFLNDVLRFFDSISSANHEQEFEINRQTSLKALISHKYSFFRAVPIACGPKPFEKEN